MIHKTEMNLVLMPPFNVSFNVSFDVSFNVSFNILFNVSFNVSFKEYKKSLSMMIKILVFYEVKKSLREIDKKTKAYGKLASSVNLFC